MSRFTNPVMLVVLCGMAFVVAAGATTLLFGDAPPCDKKVPIWVGCAGGQNWCVGTNEAQCLADEARLLSTNFFECGTSGQSTNCQTGSDPNTHLQLCYIDYFCMWDPMYGRWPDPETADEHYNWIKIAVNCN